MKQAEPGRITAETLQEQDCFLHLCRPGQHFSQGTLPAPEMQAETDDRQARMVYASSRETLKNALPGIHMAKQANDPGELEYAELIKEASKGKGTV